uniref:Uncharacterized protein n=1 Tax=Siphoviridae sp. ctM7c3 TaxID=2826257 RepID=A0A8S5M078_9CAUD|nr:MAG TPA: hypothetical protein [Siphoviridae sp. ctM7c3]DAP66811.1 MAG TPA: hypothetical protein [Caudoviricetes sp.]
MEHVPPCTVCVPPGSCFDLFLIQQISGINRMFHSLKVHPSKNGGTVEQVEHKTQAYIR